MSETKLLFKQVDPAPFTIEQIKGLVLEATAVRSKAYCPYSKFSVGCVLIDQDDQKYFGVNVENASYGLTICAELNAITSAVTGSLKKIKLIAVNLSTDKVGVPCGSCRQIIGEFADQNTIIVLSNDRGNLEITDFQSLLPSAFGPADLESASKI